MVLAVSCNRAWDFFIPMWAQVDQRDCVIDAWSPDERESRMKRVITVMGIVALMPLLMGAGGNSPGFVAGKIAGPQFLANVVLDPHEVDVPIHPGNRTSTAKQASIRIYKDHNTAAAMFHI